MKTKEEQANAPVTLLVVFVPVLFLYYITEIPRNCDGV